MNVVKNPESVSIPQSLWIPRCARNDSAKYPPISPASGGYWTVLFFLSFHYFPTPSKAQLGKEKQSRDGRQLEGGVHLTVSSCFQN
ncbi:MAG: hypothetical protein GX121_07530 [Ignavibacteria bacterium]|nr:hypothetical protein [Ignavibacteria bacterium]